MKLSEIRTNESLRVVRDGSFFSLGFVTHRRPEMLVFLASSEFCPALQANGEVSCVLTSSDLAESVPAGIGVGIVNDPRNSFYQLHNYLAKETSFYGTPFASTIAPTARIHETAFVSPANVVVEDDVEIGPKAVILPGVKIGKSSVIRAGAIIGSEGFQVYFANRKCVRVAHAGGVRIGRRVDIHSNTCVDRSVFGETSIGDDTTIDNLVHVAHDVTIGSNCRIVAKAMLGGSSRIGDEAWIGPSASVSSEVVVGNGAFVTLGAVVTRDVPDGARVTGNFAIDHERFLGFLRSIR